MSFGYIECGRFGLVQYVSFHQGVRQRRDALMFAAIKGAVGFEVERCGMLASALMSSRFCT